MSQPNQPTEHTTNERPDKDEKGFSQLEPGWLMREFESVRREIAKRPKWVKNAVRFP